jgi:hypothetical protein
MADLLTRKYADASSPGSPRNINRYPCVIGATPPLGEPTDRQEKPAQSNRHPPRGDPRLAINAHGAFELPIRSSTASVHQQIGLSKHAQQQPVGWLFTNELPAREPSLAIANRISAKARAPERILQRRTNNSLKRFADLWADAKSGV